MTAPPNAWPVPDGWKLVPCEATREMVEAMRNHYDVRRLHISEWIAPSDVWHAMLAAAPAPPVPSPRTQESLDYEYDTGHPFPARVTLKDGRTVSNGYEFLSPPSEWAKVEPLKEGKP